MRILHTVEFYHPSVGGMQEVVKQISERLVKLGHEVTVATTRLPERTNKIINGVRIVEFNISGNAVIGMSGEVERYRNFLISSDFDVMTNFAAQQWATDIALQVLDDIKEKKLLVPTGFSGLYLPKYYEYFESMKLWLSKYDMSIFLSDNYRDINFARSCGIKNLILIPNGASEDEFLSEIDIDIRSLLGIPKKNFLILHVGSHTGGKGHAEAIKIFSKAHIKNTTFLIVANEFEGGCAIACRKNKKFNYSLKRIFDKKQLVITSLSRRETISSYKDADLFLFPSNIECSPLVLFECMASKTPFLTANVGNSAEIIQWSKAGMLLPTIIDSNGCSRVDVDDSARILEDVYLNPLIRKTMGENGFKVWQERFTWGKIAKDYENLYLTLLAT